MHTTAKPGHLVISLDFELMWGMFDKCTIADYGDNLLGVHEVVPEILSLFAANDIHATWATVGMLMHPDAFELRKHLPLETEQPEYANEAFSSYRHLREKITDATDPRYYFAPDLVKKIVATPGQELASHTFSHYYCIDGGENGEAIFAADCRALKTAARNFGVIPTSIVFPRNQTTAAALHVCAKHGITGYRGTESHWLYRARTEQQQTNLFVRAIRLLDHYCNLSGHHTYKLESENSNVDITTHNLVNVPASRFLRPYSETLRMFEPLRLRRIKNAMTYAAKHGEIFHLWWHPHNFGVNRKENFQNLLEILDHYKFLKTAYGMQSKNMQEIATSTLERE